MKTHTLSQEKHGEGDGGLAQQRVVALVGLRVARSTAVNICFKSCFRLDLCEDQGF